ncbi:MAG: hypothetical protein PWR01_4577 [Clostridiales bacterium]|jgi:hypothetical protein|nr:hypothetical protein [Clostridiales bacterium]MDN5283504.1 hypothetical protein [Candidatus Ozemobacter sp.]
MMTEHTDKQEIFKDYADQICPVRLEEFLVSQTKPCWESDVFASLLPDLDLISAPAIELFRFHFVLFHHLFALQKKLFESDKYLHVHFMSINLAKYPEAGLCRHYFADSGTFCSETAHSDGAGLCSFHLDPASTGACELLSERYFYLDQANFFSVSEENAEAFIAGAWNLLMNYQDLVQCYEILGLPENTDLKLVKRHFRHLAKKYHPDINPEFSAEFSRINTAYRRLLGYLSVKPG